MSGYFKKRLIPWTSQPQYSVPANPAEIAAGLSFLWTAGNNVDVINSIVPSNIGAGAVTPQADGLAYTAAAGTGNGLSFGASLLGVVIPTGSIKYTIVVFAAPVASATRSAIFTHGSDLATPWAQHSVFANGRLGISSSGYIELNEYDGGVKARRPSIAGMVDGKQHIFVFVRDGATLTIYRDGVDVSGVTDTAGSGYATATTGRVGIGGTDNVAQALYPITLTAVFGSVAKTAAQAADITSRIWELYAPQQRNIWVSVAGGALTADANITQSSNTSTSAASLTISASASITAASNTSASASTLSLLANASITQAGNTSTAAGTLALSADASVTQSSNTSTSDSSITLSAAASITQSSNASTSGSTLAIAAGSSPTQAGNTVSSTASLVAETITADASITQASNTASSDSVLSIAAALSSTQAGNTSTAASSLALSAGATITQTGNTVSSTAALASDTITANASITQDGNTSTSVGVLSIAAESFITQAGNTLSGVAALVSDIVADANITQVSNTSSATGAVTIGALANITQSGNTISSAGSLVSAWSGEIVNMYSPITTFASLNSPISKIISFNSYI